MRSLLVISSEYNGSPNLIWEGLSLLTTYKEAEVICRPKSQIYNSSVWLQYMQITSSNEQFFLFCNLFKLSWKVGSDSFKGLHVSVIKIHSDLMFHRCTNQWILKYKTFGWISTWKASLSHCLLRRRTLKEITRFSLVYLLPVFLIRE